MNAGRENEDARSVLQTLKMIEYHYSAPAREVVTRLRLFPGSLVAGFSGFQPKAFFEAAADAGTAPKVKF